MVINRQILPEPIFSYLHSEKIRLFQKDDNVILAPIKDKPDVNELLGMFSDGKYLLMISLHKKHMRRKWNFE